MVVSYNWLKELINLNVPFEQLVAEMSLYSVEVETSSKMVNATNLVIGHVLECVPHPNSDHLHVCKVDLGEKVDQIVCGAPNVAAGQYVIAALPGAKLPGGEIKNGVIRGVESNGMLCSLQELGIENKYVPAEFANGIYVMKEGTPGEDALKHLCLDDYLIELSLTPNRMDLMSMLGVAHDMKAMYHIPINYPVADIHEIDKNTKDEIQVEIKTPNCYSYYARIVKDVKIKESPDFIKARLIAAGVRPINNVVDATNYCLMLFGQPLHSFDQDKLGKKIIVRNANQDEELITLDDQTRKLNPTDIVISDDLDNNRAVCVAGVMGGKSTEVDENTKNIVLESAVFEPFTIRKTSSRLGLRSESSVRYERGVDLNQSLMAVNYCCYLLEKYADGKVLKGYVHEGTERVDDKLITITENYIKKYLGITIKTNEIKEICELLDFKVELDGKNINVYVPNRRLDVSIKQDLVEEIARIHGYEKLEETQPLMKVQGEFTKEQMVNSAIRHSCCGLGLHECMTYSLVNTKESTMFNYLYPENSQPISLLHPMTEEHSIMRRTLIPSLLSVAAYNNARKNMDMAVYEIAKRYWLEGTESHEDYLLSGVIQGKNDKRLWANKVDNVDFYYVKGIVEQITANLGIKLSYEALTDAVDMHPGRTAKLLYNKEVIGYLGEIHPTVQKAYDVENTYAFEIMLNKIYANNNGITAFKAISKVPSVDRDLALVMDENLSVGDVVNAIYRCDKEMIKNVDVFDVYVGEHMEAGKKSVAVRITLEAQDTLTEEVINQKMKKILNSLAYLYHIELRK